MSYDTLTNTFTGVAGTQISCWCGIAFAVPASLYAYFRRQNELKPGSFAIHCPMGHSMIPAGKTAAEIEAARLRDELAREKHRTEQAEANAKWWSDRKHATDRRLSAARGQITRIKNRVSHGVCPCCQRTFENLGRHMATKHPSWTPEAGTEPIEATEGAPPAPTDRLTPPEHLGDDARTAWLRGAEAYHPEKDAACPYPAKGRYAYRARAWRDGLEAMRAASTSSET